MQIDVSWVNQAQTILLIAASGDWQWHDLSDALQRAHTLMDTAAGPVDWIIHNQDGNMPDNWLIYGRRLAKLSHPKTNRMVFVGATYFMRSMVGIFTRIIPRLGQRMQFADTLDEALALLAAATQP